MLWVTHGVQAESAEVRLENVRIKGQAQQVTIEIRGRFAMPAYAIRSRDGGKVIVLDVEQAKLPNAGLQILGKTPLVDNATASTTASGVRIEIATRSTVAYRARAQAGVITVTLEAQGKSTPDVSKSLPDKVVPMGTLGAAKLPTIRDIHLEKRNGRERVIVELSGVAKFKVIPTEQGPAQMRIEAAGLAPAATRLVKGSDKSLIAQVEAEEQTGAVILRVERRAGTTGTAIREGQRIVWLFAPGVEQDPRPSAKTIAKEEPPTVELGDLDVASPQAAGFSSLPPLQMRSAAKKTTRYSGRRIDLDLKDADIHDILRLISEVGRVNVVTSDDVKGSVTLRMQDVPWDQALEVILQAKGLGMVRKQNLIRVAPLEQLEKEREAEIARQKQNIELAPLETRLIPVSYATADKLKGRVAELLSKRGTVSTDDRTNVLIVRDLAENLDDVEQLVRTLDTQTPQVLVEARIVEASSQYSRDVGIQWGGGATMSAATGNPTGLAFPANVALTGGNYDANTPTQGLSPFTPTVSPSNFAINLPATTGTGQGGAIGLTLGSVGGNVNLGVRLSAAEANGVVRIISSPRILTLDNHEAQIAQGTLIPYSQVSAQGVQTAFQEAKLQLKVTPHVTSDGSVGMEVKVTRDEPDFTRVSSRGDPTIFKREAETHLLVADAETAVIGGIYTQNQGRTTNQVPFFGDIPIVGLLFQRRLVRDDRTELLIFLTPRIVNRSRALTR